MITLNGLVAISSLIAAWAWMISALRSIGLTGQPTTINRWISRISTEPKHWNAVAAFAAGFAALFQAIIYLVQNAPHR